MAFRRLFERVEGRIFGKRKMFYIQGQQTEMIMMKPAARVAPA